MQENLRKKVKLLKALQNVSYREIAGYIDINRNSFYNWLKGYYNLSPEKQKQLADVLSTLSE